MKNHKCKFLLAKHALYHFYNYQYLNDDESLYCVSAFNNFDYNLALKSICEENSDMIVAAVLADSTDEERIFLHDRYFLHSSFIALSFKFHIHPNGLQKWRDKFLKQINSLLNFDLPTSDVFSRNKIEALIFSLERLIHFYENFHFKNHYILDELKSKLYKYNDFLFIIKNFVNSNSNDIFSVIIRSKILYKNISLNELKLLTGYSHTTICHYIRLFQHQMLTSLMQ